MRAYQFNDIAAALEAGGLGAVEAFLISEQLQFLREHRGVRRAPGNSSSARAYTRAGIAQRRPENSSLTRQSR